MITPPSGRRWWLLAAMAMAGGVGCLLWFSLNNHSEPDPSEEVVTADPVPPDPRLAFPTTFRNVRPEAKYVGTAACAPCHEAINRTYSQHPMGRSASWVRSGETGPDARIPDHAITAGSLMLKIERMNGAILHSLSPARLPANVPAATVPPYTLHAELAIGSGRQGRSYLTIDHGAIWQSAISWFRQGDRWELSPGFGPGSASRRAVASSCLFCHVDVLTPIAGSLNRFEEPLFRYEASIGCERCHGPGELHVAERRAGKTPAGVDDSIVNPRRLSAELLGDVCRQCHLQGEARTTCRGRDVFDYRPGLPIEQFFSVFVPRPDLTKERKSVGQVEQMERSRCYIASGGQLSCISCHDPHTIHRGPEEARFYRDRCLNCHANRGCSATEAERAAKSDNCLTCHMPARASSNIVHAAVTDHRIPRRPGSATSAGRHQPDQPPLIPFRPGPHAPPQEERDRDWAVVLGLEVSRNEIAAERAELIRFARPRLEATLARWPGDAPAWTALAEVHLAQRNFTEAIKAARRAAALDPESEAALTRLAEVAEGAGDFELMATTMQKLVVLCPSSADYRATFAAALADLKRWQSAEAEARQALAIHSLHPTARVVLAACLNRLGDPRAARIEFDAALLQISTPQQRSSLSDWYLRQTH